jgi:hypothetical protein
VPARKRGRGDRLFESVHRVRRRLGRRRREGSAPSVRSARFAVTRDESSGDTGTRRVSARGSSLTICKRLLPAPPASASVTGHRGARGQPKSAEDAGVSSLHDRCADETSGHGVCPRTQIRRPIRRVRAVDDRRDSRRPMRRGRPISARPPGA